MSSLLKVFACSFDVWPEEHIVSGARTYENKYLVPTKALFAFCTYMQ